jgi:eukaryotic-like serine/threonine-protein kinase
VPGVDPSTADTLAQITPDTLGPLPSLDPSVDSALQRAAKSSFLSYPGHFTGSERYELVKPIGRGGFGVVFEAIDHAQGGRVALKVLRPNRTDQLYRFKREFRSLAELIHPNLVRLYELVARDQDVFFTMERIEGVGFLEYVRSSPERARAAMRQLAAGLNALHRSGVLHRDVKPSNVMVDGGGRLVLLDFGLAVELAAKGETAELVGTPLYMSPEQCAQQPLTAASDWYAAGVMLYEALTGTPPFAGTVMEMIARKQGEPPPPPSSLVASLPRDLDELCADLLSREPERRPSGEEVLQRLAGDSGPLQLPQRDELFVGREAERTALQAAFEESARGRRTVAMVRGPSGIGKSTLLRRFIDDVRKARPEAVILAGRCFERESVPYKALDAVVDELARHLRRLPDVESALVMPRESAALMQLFPVLADVPAFQRSLTAATPGADPSQLKSRGSAALRELLVRLADRRPLVVCVDDLQWGDVDSAVLLAELVRAPDPPAGCFVISFREEEATTSPLLSRLAQLTQTTLQGLPVSEVRLGSLPDGDAQRLAEALLAESHGDAARAEAIARESGGNPFFVGELTRHTADGELALSGLVQRRVERLDGPARRLLEVVAVAGRPIESDVAATVAQLRSELRDALATLRAERLVRARELEREKLLESYHDRIREAVVGSMDKEQLQRLHLRLADTLERRGHVDPSQIAPHFVDGGMPERALGYLVRAADKAASALAFDEAARLYQRALELQIQVEGSADLKLEQALGEAQSACGRGLDAARTFLRIAPRVDERRRIDLQRRAAEELFANGHLDEGYQALGEALAALGLSVPSGHGGAVTRILGSRARQALGGMRFKSRDALTVSDRERLRVDTLAAGFALWNTDPLMGAALQADHLRLAMKLGDPGRAAVALTMEAAVRALDGVKVHARTQALLEQAMALADQVGQPALHGWIAGFHAGVALLEGRWTEVGPHCDRAEKVVGAGLGHSAARMNAVYLRIMSRFWMGRSGDVAALLPSLLREMEERGNLVGWTWLKLMQGWPLAFAGDHAASRETTKWVRERLPERGFQLQRWWMEFAEIFYSLYARDGEDAWKRFQKRQEMRSRFAGQLQRVAAAWTGANAALARALGLESPSERAAMVRAARGFARDIERERAPWAEGMARGVRACVASLEGSPETALKLLSEAELLLETHHLESLLAAVRHTRGRMIGGDTGRALVDRAEAWMAQQHATADANWGQLPGRWP